MRKNARLSLTHKRSVGARRGPFIRAAAGLAAASLAAGCASLGLGSAVQAPVFSSVEGRTSELRVRLPSSEYPAGSAAVRLWTRIENPNAFSLAITRLAGDLFLGDGPAIAADFPLGLPLAALGDTVVPLDITVGFDDLPALGETAVDALATGTLDYGLDAEIGVDAGLLGQPVFGPLRVLSGTLDVRRPFE